MRSVCIFDLDETLVDSGHRTPNKPDGTLDLDGYFANKRRELIMRDSLLPLSSVFRQVRAQGHITVICTARDMNWDDVEFLTVHDLMPDHILNRNAFRRRCPETIPQEQKWNAQELWNNIKAGVVPCDPVYAGRDHLYKERHLQQFLEGEYQGMPKYFFDDAKPIVQHFRADKFRERGLIMLNAHTVNRRLTNA